MTNLFDLLGHLDTMKTLLLLSVIFVLVFNDTLAASQGRFSEKGKNSPDPPVNSPKKAASPLLVPPKSSTTPAPKLEKTNPKALKSGGKKIVLKGKPGPNVAVIPVEVDKTTSAPLSTTSTTPPTTTATPPTTSATPPTTSATPPTTSATPPTTSVMPSATTTATTVMEFLSDDVEAIIPVNWKAQVTELVPLMKNLQTSFGKLVSKAQSSDRNYLHPGDDTVVRTVVSMVRVGIKNFYIYRTPKLVYEEAFAWCRDRGLSLLTIDSPEKNKAVEKALSTDDHDMYWTSGNDLEHAFDFVWRSTGSSFGYTNFFPGDPNNIDNRERCVSVGREERDYVGWFDSNCADQKPFFCE